MKITMPARIVEGPFSSVVHCFFCVATGYLDLKRSTIVRALVRTNGRILHPGSGLDAEVLFVVGLPTLPTGGDSPQIRCSRFRRKDLRFSIPSMPFRTPSGSCFALDRLIVVDCLRM